MTTTTTTRSMNEARTALDRAWNVARARLGVTGTLVVLLGDGDGHVRVARARVSSADAATGPSVVFDTVARGATVEEAVHDAVTALRDALRGDLRAIPGLRDARGAEAPARVRACPYCGDPGPHLWNQCHGEEAAYCCPVCGEQWDALMD